MSFYTAANSKSLHFPTLVTRDRLMSLAIGCIILCITLFRGKFWSVKEGLMRVPTGWWHVTEDAWDFKALLNSNNVCKILLDWAIVGFNIYSEILFCLLEWQKLITFVCGLLGKYAIYYLQGRFSARWSDLLCVVAVEFLLQGYYCY